MRTVHITDRNGVPNGVVRADRDLGERGDDGFELTTYPGSGALMQLVDRWGSGEGVADVVVSADDLLAIALGCLAARERMSAPNTRPTRPASTKDPF